MREIAGSKSEGWLFCFTSHNVYKHIIFSGASTPRGYLEDGLRVYLAERQLNHNFLTYTSYPCVLLLYNNFDNQVSP